MKIIKNAYKAWSVWTAVALVAALSAREAMPLLEARLPEHTYDWIVWALAIATPILRFIQQGATPLEDRPK